MIARKHTGIPIHTLSLTALLIALAGLCGCPNRTPNGGTTSGQTGGNGQPKIDPAGIQSDFNVGVIALETGDNVRALEKMQSVTTSAPDEPAGWANLGLTQIRAGTYPEADANLKKASAMAPDSAEINALVGLLESRQGHSEQAIAAYRKAVERDPSNLRTRYALEQELERQGANEASLKDAQQQMQLILDKQPTNLFAQVEMLRLAAKRGDAETVRKLIGPLEARSGDWSAQAKGLLAEIKTASAGTNAASIGVKPVFLQNVLKQTLPALQSRTVLVLHEGVVGEPLVRLIKLANLSATPAEPDTALAYTPAPLAATPAIASIAKASFAGVFMPGVEGKPLPMVCDGRKIVVGSRTLDFPGGGAVGTHGVLPLDVNYDFKTDLALAGRGGFKLYLQGADGAFTDATAKTKLPAAVLNGNYVGAWTADIEADGDLDIILGAQSGATIVLRNNGDGTWKPINPFPGVNGLRGFAWADVDNDGSADAALLDAQGTLHIFGNERGGLFRVRPVPSTLGKVVAIAAADANNDGKMDFIALKADGAIVRISDKNDGTDWEIAEIAHWQTVPKDLSPDTARLIAADLDNNGSVDLIASSGTEAQVWLSDTKNAFAPLSVPLPNPVFAAADLSGSGMLGLIGIAADGKPTLLTGKGAKSYHWQDIRPRASEKGTGDNRINTSGIGGEVEVRAGLTYQKQTIAAPIVHFGLGDKTRIDCVRIVWPNGSVQSEFDDNRQPFAPDKTVIAEQRLVSSCPFLYTWNGKEFAFVTDCIWRSPLGLKINAQDTAGVAMTEDWIKIRGDQLVPKDGYYDLRVTAELWETHFFDHLSLMTVDHPADTEIFTDERFTIPPPPLKVEAMTPLRPIVRATDDRGTDVTELVRERDGKHVDTFGRGEFQGVTRDHYLEIELPADLPKKGPLWLVAYGWIHPTDSSINVALGQSHLPQPKGLSLETPDAGGKWSVAKPGLGFPEGKVKTVLINLDGVFKPGAPHKLRLRTNLEIYWDAVQWATGLPDTTMKTQRLDAQSAELRYRGFSVVKAADASSPELPQSYAQLSGTTQRWRDLIGYHTRFGDVRELLLKVDDRYVIMNAGDEMQLRFAAPPPPKSGWKRDFILIGDGWVKDGNVNTTFSKTVLPLPSHANPNYNTPPGRLEDDPVYRQHRADWQTYHTRYVTPEFYKRGLNPNTNNTDR